MNKIPFTYVVTALHICAVHIRTYFVQHKTKTQHNTTATKKETELFNTRKTVQSHKSGWGAKLSLRFLGRQDSLQAHIYVCGTVNWPLYIRSSTFNLFSQNQSGGKHTALYTNTMVDIYIYLYILNSLSLMVTNDWRDARSIGLFLGTYMVVFRECVKYEFSKIAFAQKAMS